MSSPSPKPLDPAPRKSQKVQKPRILYKEITKPKWFLRIVTLLLDHKNSRMQEDGHWVVLHVQGEHHQPYLVIHYLQAIMHWA